MKQIWVLQGRPSDGDYRLDWVDLKMDKTRHPLAKIRRRAAQIGIQGEYRSVLTTVPTTVDEKRAAYDARQEELSKELGREASFGDMFADSLGTHTDDPEFLRAMDAAMIEVTGEGMYSYEEWEDA